jgi:uncharacterized membrane protein YqiK
LLLILGGGLVVVVVLIVIRVFIIRHLLDHFSNNWVEVVSTPDSGEGVVISGSGVLIRESCASGGVVGSEGSANAPMFGVLFHFINYHF